MLDDINKTLTVWSERYGMPIHEAQQGSAAWFKLKLGVVSASNASKAVAKKDSETRATYMAELVGQVCTGIMEEINSKYLDWGNDHEDSARSCYEFQTGNDMIQLPFVFKDDSFRVGCSPDGIVSLSKGVEIKCPYNSTNYIRFLTDDKIKPEYHWQTQFTLWVMDAGEWDFVQYDPRMKLKPMRILTVARDEEKMKAFDDLIPAFIQDMDKMLAKTGCAFGEQWERLIVKQPRTVGGEA